MVDFEKCTRRFVSIPFLLVIILNIIPQILTSPLDERLCSYSVVSFFLLLLLNPSPLNNSLVHVYMAQMSLVTISPSNLFMPTLMQV